MEYSDAHIHIEGIDNEEISSSKLVMVCATEYSDWEKILSLNNEKAVKSYGIHPWCADQWNERARSELIDILNSNPEAGVGEIGLDKLKSDYDLQIKVFRDQMGIAAEMKRAVSIHAVKAEEEILKAVREIRGCKNIIIHGFSGSSKSIPPFIKEGCYFTVNSRILLKPENKVAEFINNIPDDRLLLETDSPYFGKQFKGIEYLINAIAEVKGMQPSELLELTNKNAEKVLL